MKQAGNETFVCGCEEAARQACNGQPFFAEFEGSRYCVLHLPSAEKREAFEAAIEQKKAAKDFNYREVWFPWGQWFARLEIPGASDFTLAAFNGPVFNGATFTGPARFTQARFIGASFRQAKFLGDAHFERATFRGHTSFDDAIFSEKAEFSEAQFWGSATFSKARFRGYAAFWRAEFRKDREHDWASFSDVVFEKYALLSPMTLEVNARFTNAKFAAVMFNGSRFAEEASFQASSFGEASFVDVEFSKGASFFSASFNGDAYFTFSKFRGSAKFAMANFKGYTLFWATSFTGETDFSSAVFLDYVRFSAPEARGGFNDCATLDLQHARFDKPDRVSFHSIKLRPHWFVNIDPRMFEFIDVTWFGYLWRQDIAREIQALEQREALLTEEAASRRKKRKEEAQQWRDELALEEIQREEAEEAQAERIATPRRIRLHRLLSLTCRQLAVNAEENHRYDEASDFRFWSMEIKRREGWRGWRRLSVTLLHILYNWLSGYGELIGRAMVCLLVIWFLFALVYTRVGFTTSPTSATPSAANSPTVVTGQPLRVDRALVYSLGVMMLQKPEPRPATGTANLTVLLETILGPVQAALLVLAVRRRFMR